jgi:hypothetical protein
MQIQSHSNAAHVHPSMKLPCLYILIDTVSVALLPTNPVGLRVPEMYISGPPIVVFQHVSPIFLKICNPVIILEIPNKAKVVQFLDAFLCQERYGLPSCFNHY